jgi:muramidase (phage lysozyme)
MTVPIYGWLTGLILLAVPLFTIPSTPEPVVSGDSEQSQVALDTTPARKAALDTIAYGEGTLGKDGYNTLFGHGKFEGFDKHPEQCIKFGNTCSTAAGRYQILDFRWKEISKQYNLPDFSPENQDKAAIALVYKEAGKVALQHIDKGNPQWIYDVCPVWASFPCHEGDRHGKYGQNPKQDLVNFYQKKLKEYQP